MARITCEEVCHCLVQLPAASFLLGISGDKCPFWSISSESSTKLLEKLTCMSKLETRTSFCKYANQKLRTSLSRHTYGSAWLQLLKESFIYMDTVQRAFCELMEKLVEDQGNSHVTYNYINSTDHV